MNSFFNAVNRKILESFRNNGFSSSQVSLLEDGFNLYVKRTENSMFGSSVLLFSLVVKTWKKELDTQAIFLGAFCTLYVLSADLFDDVQDDDLKGKTYEKVGIPIAVNNAITLLFLGLDFLVRAVELEKNDKKKLQYLKVLNKASILAVSGQHKDLMGNKETENPLEVIEMQKEKASSVSVITQCAAIFSNCSNEQIEKYKNISNQIVVIFQIVDDIKDIYGKKISPDLMTNKITYPIACFLETATEEEKLRFTTLKGKLPESIKEIRKLLHDSGSIKKSSQTIEELRRSIHNDFASMNTYHTSIRTILQIVDTMASSVYKIPFLEESRFILKPDNNLDRKIDKFINDFFENIKNFSPPEKPITLPWSSPQWMYDNKQNVIFYPDIEEQEEEILNIQAKIIEIYDREELKKLLDLISPAIMYHELFHYWRKASGNLTKDYWYEEWVANTLAISYLEKFLPEKSKEIKLKLDELLSNHKKTLSPKGKEILETLFDEKYNSSLDKLGYKVDFDEMSLIQLHMLNKLYKKNFYFGENVELFLCTFK